MRKRQIGCCVGLAGISLLSGCEPKLGDRTNILFIFSDDHALKAITAYSDFFKTSKSGTLTGFETPNIDRLAEEGAILLNNTCCNSISGPSRAAVLTGKHSHANGFTNNSKSFNPDQFTFARALQDEGYSTAMIGKWHLGDNLDPRRAGFDDYNVLINQGTYYNPEFRTPDGNKTIEGYSTDIIADLSIDWLKDAKKRNRPFLLMCQFKAPHRNWQPAMEDLELFKGTQFPIPDDFRDSTQFGSLPDYVQQTRMRVDGHMFPGWDMKLRPEETPSNYLNMYEGTTQSDPGVTIEQNRLSAADREKYWASYEEENKKFYSDNPTGRTQAEWKYQRYIRDYLRTIVAMDRNIGRLLDELDKLGLSQNTLVVYSSDQGFFLGEKGFYDKRWMYKQSFSMPFVARLPGVIPPGTKVTALTQNIDFAPTFLEVTETKVPDGAGIQGQSFLPFLKGETPASWRDALYYHFTESRAVESEHYCPAHYGVFDSRYKLIRFYESYAGDAWELYDLQEDPDESNNIYESASEELKNRLKEKLRSLRSQYGDTTGAAL